MSFSIRNVQENGLSLINLVDENTGTVVSLLPGYGASLQGWRVRLGKELFNLIDSYDSSTEVQRGMGDSFKGPKLSPFPCRIGGGKYSFEGRNYQFDQLFKDGTAIHGLLYDKAFIASDALADDAAATITLEHLYQKENQAYPWQYGCRVRYTLYPDNLLEVRTTVTNLDVVTIPMADGWHPYFRLGGKTDDWTLQFHAEAIVEFNEALIPTGHMLPYEQFETPRQVKDLFLDNCFVLRQGLVSPACELFNPANGLRISFFPIGGYPYLQLYTPPDRQSIAVENLSAAPDVFNNKMGLLLLPPGHSQTFTVHYKVSVE